MSRGPLNGPVFFCRKAPYALNPAERARQIPGNTCRQENGRSRGCVSQQYSSTKTSTVVRQYGGLPGVVPVQNRLKATVARCGQVGVHEGLTLFEGSS